MRQMERVSLVNGDLGRTDEYMTVLQVPQVPPDKNFKEQYFKYLLTSISRNRNKSNDIQKPSNKNNRVASKLQHVLLTVNCRLPQRVELPPPLRHICTRSRSEYASLHTQVH